MDEGMFWAVHRSHLWGEYWLLIVDGHASHLSTEFITFTQANKIICLCLPSYLTDLLQPLDISVFGSLKQNYKNLLSEKTCSSTYNIEKTDFITLIQKARRQGISSRNIQSACWATRLMLYNPAIVFQKILVYSKDKSTYDMDGTGASSNTPIQTQFFSETIPPALGNMK